MIERQIQTIAWQSFYDFSYGFKRDAIPSDWNNITEIAKKISTAVDALTTDANSAPLKGLCRPIISLWHNIGVETEVSVVFISWLVRTAQLQKWREATDSK